MQHSTKSYLLLLLFVVSCGEANEPTQTHTEMTEAAMAGDEDAMKNLEEKTREAAKEVKKQVQAKAASGDENAQVRAAWMSGEAAVLKLLEAGNSQALFELGQFYNAQSDEKQTKGRDWLIEAAEKGHPGAQFLVGKHSLNGLTGFKKDAVIGRKYLEQAAEGGNAEAAFTLGVALRYGFELEADKVAALKYYQQAEKGGFKDPGGELQSLTKELAE